jgi:hypothetical protein
MVRPPSVDTDGPEPRSAGNKAIQILKDLVAACQRLRWQPEADTTALTVSTWAFFHGLGLLHRPGSLAG